jgi:hypothetical protein
MKQDRDQLHKSFMFPARVGCGRSRLLDEGEWGDGSLCAVIGVCLRSFFRKRLSPEIRAEEAQCEAQKGRQVELIIHYHKADTATALAALHVKGAEEADENPEDDHDRGRDGADEKALEKPHRKAGTVTLNLRGTAAFSKPHFV